MKLEKPQGAVWIRGASVRKSIKALFDRKGVTVTEEELVEATRPHTLTIKINSYREKWIGIENGKKSDFKDPDYFIHLYQTSTGSLPEVPWRKQDVSSSEKDVYVS